ncbi:hypothetical protein [Spirosoma koreense]
MGNKAPNIEQPFTWLGGVLAVWWLVFLTPSTPIASIADRQSYFSCLMPWQETSEPDYAPTDFQQTPLTLATTFSGFLATPPVAVLPAIDWRMLPVFQPERSNNRQTLYAVAGTLLLLIEHQIAINAP